MNRTSILPHRFLLAAVFALGFASLSAQIAFLRELMVLFYGNELSLGIALGCWLFWTGAGSLLGGKIADRLRDPQRSFVRGQIAFSLLLLLTFLAVRSIRIALGVAPGQIVGFADILVSVFLVLCPLCLLNGFLFSLACASDRHSLPGGDSGRRIGLIYILEASGSVVGGLVTGFFLIRWLAPAALVFLLLGISLFASGALAFSRPGKRKTEMVVLLALALAYIAAVSFFVPERVERASLRRQWKGFDLKGTENTFYGNLALTAREGQISLFENGLLSFTRPDPSSAEEAVHFPLLMHPAPRRVLLIGGGMGGALEEALKYPSLRKAVYVEIDPGIVRLTGKHLAPEEKAFLGDPRVEIVHGDGRAYLRASDIPESFFDVIIVNLPDPFTAQINRYYTREFFALARSRLTPGGTIGISASGAENYIGGELQNYLACLHATLAGVFPQLVAIPGENCRFIASDRSDWLTTDPGVLEDRVVARGLDLKYVRSYYLADRLRPERVAYLRERLASAPRARPNLDFHPVSYFYDMVFWSTYFRGEGEGWFTRLLEGATAVRWWWFLSLPLAALAVYPSLRRRQAAGAWVLFPVLASGFSEIVFQVVILLAFQIFYGSVYHQLGLIVSLFMAGLVPGGLAMTRMLPRVSRPRNLLMKIQIALCLYPLLLPAVFALFARFPRLLSPAIGEVAVFPLLPLVAGFVGGFQFPLAARIYLGGKGEVGRTAGLVYGADLLGACLGALLVSALLIPILGVFATCLAASLLNLAALIVILARRD